MEEVILKYVQTLHPNKLVGIKEIGIVENMLIITYWCRTEFEILPDYKIDGIPEDGVKSVAMEKWNTFSEILNKTQFFTWCVDNIDDHDLIIDINSQWNENVEIIKS